MRKDEFEETLAVDEADTLYGRMYYTGHGAIMTRYAPEPAYDPNEIARIEAEAAAELERMKAEAAAMEKYVAQEIAWQEKETTRDIIDRPKAVEKAKRAVGQAKGKVRAMTRRTVGLRRKLESTQNQIKKIERGM